MKLLALFGLLIGPVTSLHANCADDQNDSIAALDIPEELSQRAQRLALTAFQLLHIRGNAFGTTVSHDQPVSSALRYLKSLIHLADQLDQFRSRFELSQFEQGLRSLEAFEDDHRVDHQIFSRALVPINPPLRGALFEMTVVLDETPPFYLVSGEAEVRHSHLENLLASLYHMVDFLRAVGYEGALEEEFRRLESVGSAA